MATYIANAALGAPESASGDDEIRQVGGGQPGRTGRSVAASDSAEEDVYPGGWTALATLVSLAIGFGISVWLQRPAFAPLAGFNTFAVMYVVAQAIERLEDPFVPFLGRAKIASNDKSGGASTVGQRKAIADRDKAVVAAINDPSKAATAANAQRTVDQVRANLTLLMWGTSSALAMIASGWFGLYLLKDIGVVSVPLWVDSAVTGLAIGAGTKPLHDLISNMSANKTKQDPVQTQ